MGTSSLWQQVTACCRWAGSKLPCAPDRSALCASRVCTTSRPARRAAASRRCAAGKHALSRATSLPSVAPKPPSSQKSRLRLVVRGNQEDQSIAGRGGFQPLACCTHMSHPPSSLEVNHDEGGAVQGQAVRVRQRLGHLGHAGCTRGSKRGHGMRAACRVRRSRRVHACSSRLAADACMPPTSAAVGSQLDRRLDGLADGRQEGVRSGHCGGVTRCESPERQKAQKRSRPTPACHAPLALTSSKHAALHGNHLQGRPVVARVGGLARCM